MGWNSLALIQDRTLRRLALTASAVFALAGAALAQGPGGGGGGTATDIYTSIANNYLTLTMGVSTNVGGYIQLVTNGSFQTDPNAIILNIPPPNGGTTTGGGGAGGGTGGGTNTGSTITPIGTRVFLRVNGGINNLSRGGWDYTFGDQTTGFWIEPPTQVGTHLEARWETSIFTATNGSTPGIPPGGSTGTGTGTGNGGGNGTGNGNGNNNGFLVSNEIEVDMIATLVHDTARFQFNIINQNPGTAQTVGLLFVQDIQVVPNSNTVDGPIQVPGQPLLYSEALFLGNQVPKEWESIKQITGPTSNQPAVIHSIKGTLRPNNSSVNDPTPPTRFAYGDIIKLSDFSLITGTNISNIKFSTPWDFQPDPTIILGRPVGAGVKDAAVGLFWDEQPITAGQTIPITTYIGEGDTDNDFTPPMSLSVTGPSALSYTQEDDPNHPGQKIAVPTYLGGNTFPITAYVQNETDLTQTGGLSLGPVNLFLQLPKGLTTTSTNPQQIATVTAGGESNVGWTVMPDPANPVTGTLTYTVTATPNLGAAKTVQRTIEIPALAKVPLIGNAVAKGLFQMLSLPFNTGNAAPSTILGLASNPPNFDIVRYDPTQGHYVPVNTFQPGLAYWFRSRQPNTVVQPIDVGAYPPLTNQLQPTSQTYTVTFPQGWNQIGNPYVYGIRFSDIQVFDPDSQQLLPMTDAAGTAFQWVSPAVYHYNTSDPNPANWSYELLDSLGFTMQPYDGYWVFVNKPQLQFIFSGVNTAGVTLTRAAATRKAGLGTLLGQGTLNNWRLRLSARSTSSSDLTTYIGVAPQATDGLDFYKYPKPPLMDNQLSLAVVHNDWGRSAALYGQDLRSPAQTLKTWNLTVRSAKPGDQVTLTWPGIAASVPRNYQLTLIDPSTNRHVNLRTTPSYVVTTDNNATRSISIEAQPSVVFGMARITSFDVVANGRGNSRAAAPASVTINYTLTRAADTHIIIRDSGGRTLRTITTTTRASGGNAVGSAVWDLRDAKGAILAPGLYSVELSALGSDGSQARQVRPFLLTR